MKKIKNFAGLVGPLLALGLLSGCANNSEQMTSAWTDFVDAELVEFSISDTPCTFSDKSLELPVTLTNNTEQKIVEIEASAFVNDLDSDEITELNVVGGGSFGPSEQLNVGSWGELCYDMDDSSQKAKQLLELDDLRAKTDVVIKVKKISFENGQSLEF